MAGQCQLAPAAERHPGNRGGDRLAHGFEPAQRVAEREEVVERNVEPIRRWGRDDHVVSRAEFGEIGTGAETAGLARAHQHTARIAAVEPFGEGVTALTKGSWRLRVQFHSRPRGGRTQSGTNVKIF